MAAHRSYSFGEFTLDVSRGTLSRAGVEVKLRPKSFQVLQTLVERHGELVTKDELLDRVWGRTIVTEGSVTQCLIDIRRALGDDAQAIVRTVPRRGYLFDIPVATSDAAEHGGSVEPAAPAAGAGTSSADAAAGPSATTTAPASPIPTNPGSSRRRRVPRKTLATLLVVIAALGTSAWWGLTRRSAEPDRSTTGGASAERHTIAVLPFVNMSPEPDQEFFSDGIAEEILNLLAQSDDFKVIARTSSFAFKGQSLSVADIAQRLKVAYVLEGSVRKSGQRLRITAQLVETAHSAHLWSETYDRELEDTFAIQTEIAARFAAALKAKLAEPGEQNDYEPVAAAHERFLRAQFFYHRRAPGDIELAKHYYEEALGLDPRYARAWAGLAGVYGVEFSEGTVPVSVGLEQRRMAVEQALANDPNLAEAHMRAAQHFWETGDGKRAADHAARAFALDRNDPLVLSHYCTVLAWQDRFDDALELEDRMVTRDPFSLAVRINLANTLLAAGRLDEARAEFLKTVEISPDWQGAVDVELGRIMILEQRYPEALDEVRRWPEGVDRDHGLALIYDALGRKPDADAAVARLLSSSEPGAAVRLAEVYASRGDVDEAFDWVATAYSRLGENPWLSVQWQWVYPLRFSPFLEPLHSDSRWTKMKTRGLPPGTEAVLRDLPAQLTAP
jgi:TolB-like protein/DNA-binding winged helix-turn-helix (wHTH) protein/Flp pilus assembly protein TadD